MSLRPVSMINKINKHANKKFYFAEVCFTSSCVGWLHRQHSIMKSERELNELLFPSQYRQNGNRKKKKFFQAFPSSATRINKEEQIGKLQVQTAASVGGPACMSRCRQTKGRLILS